MPRHVFANADTAPGRGQSVGKRSAACSAAWRALTQEERDEYNERARNEQKQTKKRAREGERDEVTRNQYNKKRQKIFDRIVANVSHGACASFPLFAVLTVLLSQMGRLHDDFDTSSYIVVASHTVRNREWASGYGTGAALGHLEQPWAGGTLKTKALLFRSFVTAEHHSSPNTEIRIAKLTAGNRGVYAQAVADWFKNRWRTSQML